MTTKETTKSIVAHSLYDFCKDIQKAFEEGYVFDFDKSENSPVSYGHMMTCIMLDASNKALEQTKEIVNTTIDATSALIENTSENINEVVTQVNEQITDAVTQATNIATEAQAKPSKKKK